VSDAAKSVEAPEPSVADMPPPPAEVLPEAVDRVAMARLYGEPLFTMPHDLYIPPDALEVFLEAFEGPLDLLLYLIRKQNFNILDIPLADVTRQYLAYVDQIRKTNLELASEYLLMAAMLIEIKSRMLLPMKKADSGDEAADPRAELVRRLVEYERMKLAAARLDELPRVGRDFARAIVAIEQTMTRHLPTVDVVDLQTAWNEVLKRARLHAHHHISREELSVREHMSQILRSLKESRVRQPDKTSQFVQCDRRDREWPATVRGRAARNRRAGQQHHAVLGARHGQRSSSDRLR